MSLDRRQKQSTKRCWCFACSAKKRFGDPRNAPLKKRSALQKGLITTDPSISEVRQARNGWYGVRELIEDIRSGDVYRRSMHTREGNRTSHRTLRDDLNLYVQDF